MDRLLRLQEPPRRRAEPRTTGNLPTKQDPHKIPTTNWPRQPHAYRNLLRVSAGREPDWKAPAIGLEPITCRLTEGLS